jgi:hypothetical protein
VTALIKPLIRLLIDSGVEGIPPTPAYCYTVTTTTSTSGVTGTAGALQPTITYYYEGGYYSYDALISLYGYIPPGTSIAFYNDLSGYSSASSGTITTSKTVCIPGDPGVEAVPPTYEELTYNAWNSGATSIDNFAVDGQIKFDAPSYPQGIIIGLNNYNQTPHYYDIKYGIYFHANTASVFESGVNGTSVTYVDTDEFAISRQDGVIYYIKNGTIFASTVTTITDTLFVDVSIYGLGDLQNNVNVTSSDFIVDMGEVEFSSSAAFDFEPATSIEFRSSATTDIFGIIDGEVYGEIEFAPSAAADIEGSLTLAGEIEFGSSSTFKASEWTTHYKNLPPLEGYSYDYPYGRCDGDMSALTSVSYAGWMAPTIESAFGVIGPLITSAHGLTGGVGGTGVGGVDLQAIGGLSSDYAYGEADGSFSALTNWAGELLATDGSMVGTFPEVEMDAWGYASALNGLDARFPEFTFDGEFGSEAELIFPEITTTITATADWGVVGRSTVDAPEFTLTSNMLVGGIGTADVTANFIVTLASYSGEGTSFLVPAFSLTASGTVGSIGTATINVPEFSLTASATDEIFGSASLTFPEFSTLYGTTEGVFPEFTLAGIITADYTSSQLAYVLNMKLEEMTKYTNYGFDYIVRFGGQNYGVKSNGLYLLGGADDSGTDIPETVKFNDLDFGSTLRKRLPYLYLDCVDDTDVTTFVDRTEIGTYRSRLGNKRTKLARGPKGRYWTIEIQNVLGNKLDIRNIELFPHILDRKV